MDNNKINKVSPYNHKDFEKWCKDFKVGVLAKGLDVVIRVGDHEKKVNLLDLKNYPYTCRT